MSSYQGVIESMMFDLLSEQRFSMSKLEQMMKARFPGRYTLATDVYDTQDIGRIRILFEDQYAKTEWMMRWA